MTRDRRPQRSDPYATPVTTAGRLARLLLLFLVVLALVSAGTMVYSWWLQGRLGGDVRLEPGHAALGPVEAFYLQLFLTARAAGLEEPAGDALLPATFVVESGQSATTIATRLSAAGLLQDESLFVNYVRYYGLDARLEAGTYQVDPQLPIPELAALLTRSLGQEITIRFIEGWRLEEMADSLRTTAPARVDVDEFLAIVRRQTVFDLSPYGFLAGLPPTATLEGYLFPDTYSLPLEADAAYVVNLMLRTFDARVTPQLRQAMGTTGLTLHESVSLASIVEREAVVADERPIIAGVFLNRLRQGIKLDADPTVQYALGRGVDGEWWKAGLTLDDLAVASPYNTYAVPGLPPGPIANPGLGSLESVGMPAATQFLFFVASCAADAQGRHIFSLTYEEHLAHVTACR